MIPLVKPQFPSWGMVRRYLEKSKDQGKMSNFGPCYWALVERLSHITNRYDVPCTSGTAAIQLVLQATFPRGTRVLIPDYTHIGTLQAVVAAGMVPVMGSVSRRNWTLSLSQDMSKDFDAMVVVSPFGYTVRFDQYDAWAEANGKKLVYDLAGGFGMVAHTKNPVAYSMHATKNIPVGEGGIASFKTSEEADLAFKLSCFDQNKDRSIASPYGNNLKLDEFRCAIALAQLESMEAITARIHRKMELIDYYQDELGDACIPHKLYQGNAAPSLCVVAGLPADRLEPRMKELGFEVKQYYPLLTEMEGLSSVARLSQSSPYFRTCVALPSDVSLEEAKRIAQKIRQEIRSK